MPPKIPSERKSRKKQGSMRLKSRAESISSPRSALRCRKTPGDGTPLPNRDAPKVTWNTRSIRRKKSGIPQTGLRNSLSRAGGAACPAGECMAFLVQASMKL